MSERFDMSERFGRKEGSMALLTRDVLRDALKDDPGRFAHIEGAVRLANRIEKRLGGFEKDGLTGRLAIAALYHDAGRAPIYRETGFHAIDGALLAKRHGLDEEVCSAILHHSGSWQEAQTLRPDLAARYYDARCHMMDTLLSRALTYCDLHTGPDGNALTLEDRLKDVQTRHPPLRDVLTLCLPSFRQIEAEMTSRLGEPTPWAIGVLTL